MLDIRLYDQSKNAELFINYDSESISFTTVLSDGTQFDFDCNVKDWELIKSFIDLQIK